MKCTHLFSGSFSGTCFTLQGANFTAASIPGLTPLAAAAGGGHLAVVQYLASLGAPSDEPDNFGRTPLYDAVRGGHRASCLLVCNVLDREI